MTLHDELWSQIKDVYDAVVAHPFCVGLIEGTLPEEALRYLVVQDLYHLHNYARALTVCAAKAPTQSDVALLARYAVGAITAQQGMRRGLADMLPGSGAVEPVGPTTEAYGSFLLATCFTGSFAEALGALLPCYWFYPRLAEQWLRRSSPNPRYERWIKAYHPGERYQALLDALLELVDRVGEAISPMERARLVERLVTASRYEWMFADAAWHRLAWPV